MGSHRVPRGTCSAPWEPRLFLDVSPGFHSLPLLSTVRGGSPILVCDVTSSSSIHLPWDILGPPRMRTSKFVLSLCPVMWQREIKKDDA